MCVVTALLCSCILHLRLSLPPFVFSHSQLSFVHASVTQAARKIRRIAGSMACSSTTVYVPYCSQLTPAPHTWRFESAAAMMLWCRLSAISSRHGRVKVVVRRLARCPYARHASTWMQGTSDDASLHQELASAARKFRARHASSSPLARSLVSCPREDSAGRVISWVVSRQTIVAPYSRRALSCTLSQRNSAHPSSTALCALAHALHRTAPHPARAWSAASWHPSALGRRASRSAHSRSSSTAVAAVWS